jgi:hypothetical protein
MTLMLFTDETGFTRDGIMNQSTLAGRCQSTWNHSVATPKMIFNKWSTRSPDLTPLDFYLWGHLKSTVYAASVDDVAELQRRADKRMRVSS